MTDIDATVAAYSTNARLAEDLKRLADNIRRHSPDEPAAKLREAARRLEEHPGFRQLLISLSDGTQVGVYLGKGDATVTLRRGIASTWGLPLPRADADRPHGTGTYHIGEW